MIRLILIRHGRTAWNLDAGQGKRFRGTIDLPLISEGLTQASITAQRLASLPLAAVYSSPLQQAFYTADMIAEPHGLTAKKLDGLVSMDYGQWAGQFDFDVAERWPDLYEQWRHDPFSLQIPDGESTADLRDRALAAVRTTLASHTDGDTIALISHQVVTKSLVCALAGLPNAAYWRVRQDLCNLTRFDYDLTTDEFALVGLNDTCHLNPALPQSVGDGTRVILIRHGQTAWNEGAGEERFRGRTDLPLDDFGQAQARAVSRRLDNEPVAALYASPLLRTRQTAAPVADRLGLPVRAHDGLIDIDYGQFQGLTHMEAAAVHANSYRLWRTNPGAVRFPGGESLAEVQARLLTLMEEMATCHPGQAVALVGHQIVNKVLACTLLGLDLDKIWRVQQDTCGLDVFQKTDGGWATLCLNEVCHLSS